MADRLYLSYQLRGFSPVSMLQHYEKMLKLFPFSRLRKAESTFRIYALEHAEPPLIEVPVVPPVDPGAVIASAREFQHADEAYELETAWDLWRFEGEWKLAPSMVILSCFGPEFASENGEHLQIDFGLDEQFLPVAGGTESIRMVRENIQSLLHLVHEIDDKLNVESRKLMTESGENFAERLQATLRSLA